MPQKPITPCVCQQCGTTYYRTKQAAKRSRFCSPLCNARGRNPRRSLKSEDRICARCGMTFRFRLALEYGDRASRNSGKYCSRTCKVAAQTHKVEVTCERCGKKRLVSPSQANCRFCSNACAGNQASDMQATCVICGILYRVTPSQAMYTKCCSRECMNRYKSTQPYRHDEHPRYRLFNREWRELRLKIIERDGGVCMRCGGTNRLAVHHITPWALTRDDSPENLVTLCDSCHRIVESETERIMLSR